MSTGCDTCDQHNRPMLSRDGLLADHLIDLHRAVHDSVRAFGVRIDRVVAHMLSAKEGQ